MMDAKLLIAIIGAVAAVIAAIISCISAYWVSKKSAKNLSEIEKMKLSFEKEGAKRAIIDNETKLMFEGFSKSLQYIQQYKDEIQVAIQSVHSRLPAETILARLATSREELFKAYEKYHSYMPKEDTLRFHAAKNCVQFVYTCFQEILAENARSAEIKFKTIPRINRMRKDLSDIQQVLSDHRGDMIVRLNANMVQQ